MKGNQGINLAPAATFVIEREAGKGYHVKSSAGPLAGDLETPALALLDVIGQPDPSGPEEYFRWLRPVAPSGAHVGVVVRLKPNGEARFHQAWFDIASLSARPPRLFRVSLLTGAIFVSIAAVAVLMLVRPPRWTPVQTGSPAIIPDQQVLRAPENLAPQDERVTRFQDVIASSREVRSRLKAYLSQEGFAADLSKSVVDEKRSVKLIDDLDRAPPAEESMRLSSVEVAKLIRLMDGISDFESMQKP
jgi:hypothetical protein